jgi:hypothetical protein
MDLGGPLREDQMATIGSIRLESDKRVYMIGKVTRARYACVKKNNRKIARDKRSQRAVAEPPKL